MAQLEESKRIIERFGYDKLELSPMVDEDLKGDFIQYMADNPELSFVQCIERFGKSL